MNNSVTDSADYDASELADTYQSLSVLGVLALLFGLLSPAVLFGTLAAVIPCAAIFLATLALRQIARSDGAVVGRGLATWGLALGVLCLAAWIAYGQTYRYLIHQAAQPVAQAWLDSIQQHRVQDAYLLTLPAEQRAAVAAYFDSPESHAEQATHEDASASETATPPASPAETQSPKQKLEEFQTSPDVATLLAAPGLSGYQLLSRGPIVSYAGRVQVELTYQVTLGEQPPVACTLTLDRTRPKNNRPFWRIGLVKLGAAGD